MSRRRILSALSLAVAGLFLYVLERPRAKFVMTTFDPGTSRAE